MNTKLSVLLLIIGISVHQEMCTANPIDNREDKEFLKRPYTAQELQIARSAGISDVHLFVVKNIGLNFEEICRLHTLINRPMPQNTTSILVMTEACELLDHDHKTASDSTNALLEKLLTLMEVMPEFERLVYVRSKICGYLSEPYENMLTNEAIAHEKFRFLKENVYRSMGGMTRVKLVKRMCCVGRGGDFVAETKVGDLTENEMAEFDERWRSYKKAIGPNSFQNVCHFLDAKYPNDDECQVTDESFPLPGFGA